MTARSLPTRPTIGPRTIFSTSLPTNSTSTDGESRAALGRTSIASRLSPGRIRPMRLLRQPPWRRVGLEPAPRDLDVVDPRHQAVLIAGAEMEHLDPVPLLPHHECLAQEDRRHPFAGDVPHYRRRLGRPERRHRLVPLRNRRRHLLDFQRRPVPEQFGGEPPELHLREGDEVRALFDFRDSNPVAIDIVVRKKAR